MPGCPGAGLGEQELPEGAGGPILVLQEGAVGGLCSAPGRCSTQLCTELLLFPVLVCFLGWMGRTNRENLSRFLFLTPLPCSRCCRCLP